MAHRTKKVTLTGLTPLIMHKDGMDFEGLIKSWRMNPANKDLQVKGDDRSPAWTWIGSVYHDGKMVGIPSDNIMTVLREGGSKVSTGKRQGTFKRQSQTGIIVMEPLWPVTTAEGNQIEIADINVMLEETDFDKQMEVARKLGISLFVKRAKLATSKNVRVRPMFAAGWKISGTVSITDNSITDSVFSDILMMAGDLSGLCDWRPSSPKSPGPYGRFTAVVK
jgi:hypothetical protein